MRPSIKTIDTVSGHTILIDTALAKSKDVLIVAIGSTGNFSSKILSESHVAAFTTEQAGELLMGAEEILEVLKRNEFVTENGVILVRARSEQELRFVPGLLEFCVVGELQLDHVLSLLLATKPEIK